MYRLEIAEPAQADIQANYDWWRLHRSEEQAHRWYRGMHEAIRSLRQAATRCPQAPESELHPSGLRQLLFGIGRRPTHRIVFTLEENMVRIVRVRHASQRDLQSGDLE
jgi:plasmid stabilization system protein ParE